jgi:hypothetical protein
VRRVGIKGAGVATTAMVNVYLEQLLLEEYGDDVETSDGGYEIPLAGGLRIWVIDGNHRTRRVLVTARLMAVEDVTLELLETINQLNAVTLYGRFFLLDDEVQVEDTLLADVLDPASLLNSIGFVVWATDAHRDMLQERFGELVDTADIIASTVSEVELPDRVAGLIENHDTGSPGGRGERVINAGGYL